MVTLPAEGRWSVRPVAEDDLTEVLAFLKRDPLINVYLVSRLMEEHRPTVTQICAIRRNRELVLVAALSSNVVLATDQAIAGDVTRTAIGLVADRILTRLIPVRAIISPAPAVEELWQHLRTQLDPPTVVRMSQPVYAIRKRFDFPDLDSARYSTMKDLDQLVPACAAMHREEVGIDPLARDAIGYADRIRELVELKRSVILVSAGRIAAKCEYSAVTDEAVQLMGVWTNPELRRRGHARELLREVCGHLFRRAKTVTLFVNDFNTPAIALYENLGFRRIGVNRALIW